MQLGDIHVTPEMAARYGAAIGVVMMMKTQKEINKNQIALTNAETKVGVSEALDNAYASASNVLSAGVVEGLGYGMQGIANMALAANAMKALKDLGNLQKEYDTSAIDQQVKDLDRSIKARESNAQTAVNEREGIEIQEVDENDRPIASAQQKDKTLLRWKRNRKNLARESKNIKEKMKLAHDKLDEKKASYTAIANIVQNNGQVFGSVAAASFNSIKIKQDAAQQINQSGAQSLESARQSGFTSSEMMQQAEGRMLDGAVAASGRA